MLHKPLILIALLVGVCSLMPASAQSQGGDLRPFDLLAAFNRIPTGEWETLGFTDLSGTMQTLDQVWPPASADALTPQQQAAWNGVWQPPLFSLALEPLGFSAFQVEHVAEARRKTQFVLWLEGQFSLSQIAAGLLSARYEALPDFSAESYRATTDDKWREVMPYISLPDGNTLLIASSETGLRSLLNVYDGLATPFGDSDKLLQLLGTVSAPMTSGVLRLDRGSVGCALESSRLVAHGLRYDSETAIWQYHLTIGYPSETVVTNVQGLADSLEFSTYSLPNYDGVIGQHTRIINQILQDDSAGSVLQFNMNLYDSPEMPHLPFDLARQTNTCALFSAPPASAMALAATYVPDLSGGRLDLVMRFGNAEQALYNAGLPAESLGSEAPLDERQQIALNSTWRTALVFEKNFTEWFGFSPDKIRQTVELELKQGDYVRILWGDFSVEQIEAALAKTGYVAIEQYAGTRIFTLRNVPQAGGFLLSSLTQTAAAPQDGVLIFTNQNTNLRLTLDILNRTFQTTLVRSQDFTLASRALGDATNITLRRFVNPLSGGLVCGLPPYRVEGFANVLRPDGWHFLYVLGFNRVLDGAEAVAAALAEALESSDYPLQGPGSATFGELSTVYQVETFFASNSTVLLIDLSVFGSDQQASFFGQDLAQATLTPCALGDITQ